MSKISSNNIAQAIYLGLRNKPKEELPQYFKNVIKFLARKKLLLNKNKIIQKIQELVDKDNGVVSAQVYTTHELDTETRATIKTVLIEKYKARDVVLSEKIDKNILGGFKIEIGDEIIDLSLKNKLAKLQEHLTKTA